MRVTCVARGRKVARVTNNVTSFKEKKGVLINIHEEDMIGMALEHFNYNRNITRQSIKI